MVERMENDFFYTYIYFFSKIQNKNKYICREKPIKIEYVKYKIFTPVILFYYPILLSCP